MGEGLLGDRCFLDSGLRGGGHGFTDSRSSK